MPAINLLSLRKLAYIIVVMIAVLSTGCVGPQTLDVQEFCIPELSETEEKSYKYNAVIATYNAVGKNNLSIWDPDFLLADQPLTKALKEFNEGKRGRLAKQIKLNGKSAQEIHRLLLNKKFSHKQIPLKVRGDDKNYWLKNGGITQDINDPDIVLMDIYVHKDGSMIRMKSFGVPDDFAEIEPRRMPHVSKSVLKNLCQGKKCIEDTSFLNEAFKVTDEGFPVPKSSSPKAGLMLPYYNDCEIGKMLNEVVMDTNAVLSHINLRTECDTTALIIK